MLQSGGSLIQDPGNPQLKICMKSAIHLLLLTLLVFTSNLSAQNGANSSMLRSGPIPEMDGFTAEGEPLSIQELCSGKYTVLASGCLTCPQFHNSYGEIEAAFADYKSEDIQFFYFYKSLRHPELEGFVEAQNIQERLLQLAAAREKLGTSVPWIADTIDDSMRTGLGANSQSVFLISPEGKVLYGNGRIVRNDLRNALSKALGKPKTDTQVSDLDLPAMRRNSMPPNQDSKLGVKREDGLTIVATKASKPEETYYVKLRAEADEALIKTGTGRLFIGFYPDPIHNAYWNNLTPPMRYTLTTPEGLTASPAQASAEKGTGDSDTLPRQFWVDIKSDSKTNEIQLQLDYYGCTPDMCMALTHEYTIVLEDEDRGARTAGMNRGNRGQGGRQANARGGRQGNAPAQGSRQRGMQLTQMDTNNDGVVNFEEMSASIKTRRGNDVDLDGLQRRFTSMDTDSDGNLSAEELENAPRGQRGRNR